VRNVMGHGALVMVMLSSITAAVCAPLAPAPGCPRTDFAGSLMREVVMGMC